MNALSGGLLRIVCAAVISAMVGSVGADGAGKGIRRLAAGLFLVLSILSPLEDVELPELDTARIRSDAEAAVRSGTEQAAREKNAIISEALEAYIWNKAAGLGLELEIRVTLDEQGIPKTVELTGWTSPEDRQTLGDAITRDLGLGKEAQIWTIPYQSSE